MTWPDDDPIIAAGFVVCGVCGGESYPVAAVWITSWLVLATYDAGCAKWCSRWSRIGTVLLDLDGDDPTVPHVQRPRLCRGATRAGNPCRAVARPGSGFCWHHDPARRGAR